MDMNPRRPAPKVYCAWSGSKMTAEQHAERSAAYAAQADRAVENGHKATADKVWRKLADAHARRAAALRDE
jgi:phage gp37-like protein